MSQFNITRRALLRSTAFVTLALGAASFAPGVFAQGTPTKGGILRVSVNARVDSINPMKPKSSAGHMAVELLYSGLTRIGTDLVAQPDLAESWTSNDDASSFTFTLRDAKFHSGAPVTAKDVVATITAILNKDNGSPGRTQIGPITKVEAADDRNVVFTLDGSFADLPVSLGSVFAKIISAEALAGDLAVLDTTPAGSGPFVLTEFDPARIISVRRNDGYYDPERPYLDGVDQLLYPDATGEAAALVNKETDLLLEANPTSYARLAETAGIVGERVATGNFLNLVLRVDQKPFDDIRVRQALALALDRQALVDVVLEGFGRPADDSIISPEASLYTAPKKAAYDPEKAKALLAEAGYSNGIDVVLYAAAVPPLRTTLAVAVKEFAAPAGFNIEVKTVPMDEYLANVFRKANFYVGSWNMGPTQDYWYNTLLTSGGALADTGWNNAGFDEAIATARRTTDVAERTALYAKAQDIVTTELPYIVPFFLDRLAARAEYVNGLQLHPLNQPYQLDRVWLGAGAQARG
jgi:peptide/nickel transport system substrate-binding protein